MAAGPDDPVQPLVRRPAVQAAELLPVGTELDIVERERVELRRQRRLARVPACADRAPGRARDVPRQRGDFAGRRVAAHEADAGDLAAVPLQQSLQRARGQRLSLVPLQMGTVAPGASVRAARQVQRERHLVGNFLKKYRQVLARGGQIHFKTDNDKLFEWSVEEIPQFGFELSEVTRDLHADGPVGVMTDYEKKFYDEGKSINRCVATMVDWAEPEEGVPSPAETE